MYELWTNDHDGRRFIKWHADREQAEGEARVWRAAHPGIEVLVIDGNTGRVIYAVDR